jgi:hypothetical protein
VSLSREAGIRARLSAELRAVVNPEPRRVAMSNWLRTLLAVLLLLSCGLELNDEPEEEEVYGCICDGANGECRPHPLSTDPALEELCELTPPEE